MEIIGEAARAVKAVWGDLTTPEPTVYGGGGGGGGGFEMSPSELQTVIGLWQDQLDKITEDGMTIERIIAGVLPPGEDEASSSYVAASMESIHSLQQQNDSMKKYVVEYIEKLELAKTKTMVTDQANADVMRPAT